MCLNLWKKGTENGSYNGPLSQVSNLGCLQRSRRKHVNHHNHTEPCKHGRAATGKETVPFPPSIACCSPALHQEGRSLSDLLKSQEPVQAPWYQPPNCFKLLALLSVRQWTKAEAASTLALSWSKSWKQHFRNPEASVWQSDIQAKPTWKQWGNNHNCVIHIPLSVQTHFLLHPSY